MNNTRSKKEKWLQSQLRRGVENPSKIARRMLKLNKRYNPNQAQGARTIRQEDQQEIFENEYQKETLKLLAKLKKENEKKRLRQEYGNKNKEHGKRTAGKQKRSSTINRKINQRHSSSTNRKTKQRRTSTKKRRTSSTNRRTANRRP
tara:strand:- start:464 stop:904 length:441 start_codon:yes stop_codon:yes gene_type:complete